MQATTYKLSITSTWLLLLAIVLAGAGILIASSEDDPPVYGFTNETCDSERSMYFPRLSSLIAFDGETDGFGNTWNFGSYLEADASSYECHLVEFEEITVKGTRSSSSGRGFGAAGGGGGGRSSGGTGPGGNPAPENPADEFTEDKAEEIKSCWEEKVSEEDLDGWDSDAEADDISSWRNARGSAPGYGHTQGTSEGPGGELLTIGVTIYTDVIAAETRATFEHLVAFVQMHEKIHVFQYLREASDDDGITLPSPYEQHEMEVQAHNYSYAW